MFCQINLTFAFIFIFIGNNEGANIVKTRADKAVDYVSNNLEFTPAPTNATNAGWNLANKQGNSTATIDALIAQNDFQNNNNLINPKLAGNIDQFSRIITTEGLNKVLNPGEDSGEKTLILTKMINPENKSDTLTYSNLVEVVQTTNSVGRRMAYSVAGNQHPNKLVAGTANEYTQVLQADEVDASFAERVVLLPPFGNEHFNYILWSAVAIILIGGITFIIRKVLKK